MRTIPQNENIFKQSFTTNNMNIFSTKKRQLQTFCSPFSTQLTMPLGIGSASQILVSSIYHETVIRQGVWLSININGSPQNEESEDLEE